MTNDRRSIPARTLSDARCALSRTAPEPDAPPEARRAHHLGAAALYRRVAETDPAHHHEALAYADVEESIYAAEAERPKGCSCRHRKLDDQVRRTPDPRCTVHRS